MKKLIKHILVSVTLISGVAIFQSCNLDEFNPNQFDAGGFWNTQTQFEGNLTALMNQWRANYDQNVMFNAGELRTDYYWPVQGIDGSGLYGAEWNYNQYTNSNTQFTNYMNIYGLISNCNTFLFYNEQKGDVLADNCRNYLLGMIYGMRAWAFFQIHKMYGTGPLRVNADVILGNYDPTTLYMTQAPVEDFLNQIKSDLENSLQHFNASAGYSNGIFNANRGVYYWSKAASEMLAGEVYLWSGKVSTGNHVANPADVATAQKYFENVYRNYGYSLSPTYNDAINTKTNNTERIFSTYYGEGEATTNWFNYITWDFTTGGARNNYWNCVEKDGTTWSTTAQRLAYYTDPATGVKTFTDFYNQKISGQSRYQVRNAYFYQFDNEDSRIKIFQPNYQLTKEELENDVQFVENFDFESHILAACWIWKYHGSQQTGSERFIGTNDMMYYRLASTILYLAECANYAGDNNSVVNYINEVRARAYGNNWDESKYGYVAGSFAENETAILQERAKELFQEGDRWWSLRRMTTVKGGTDRDHMVFQPQGCIGYGLDAKLAAHPTWGEIRPTDNPFVPIETKQSVLDYDTQKHIVLWPLDATLLGSDPALLQTPGYAYTDPDRTQPWIEH